MANRDILVLNTTQSRAETQQGTDAVTLRADSSVALSIESTSGDSIVSVNTTGSTIGTTVSANITASGNITSSVGTTTASFGRLEGTTLIGSAFNLSNTDLDHTLSASSQIANEISGSFRQGFEFTGLISGSRASTGSFGKIEVAGKIFGDANNLTNSQLDNTVSSSAQLATAISGAFNAGFEFTGEMSSSRTSTGSFNEIISDTFINGDVTNLTIPLKSSGTISSSAQLSSSISGSFIRGFEYTGEISGSRTSTGSFAITSASLITGDVSGLTGNTDKDNTISSSAQLATSISGSFNKGFTFSGVISGSRTSTGSFSTISGSEISGDATALTNTIPTGTVSSSAQLATAISGSFNKGFEFSGDIESSPPAWSLGPSLYEQSNIGGNAVGQSPNAMLAHYGTGGDVFNGSSWSEITAAPSPTFAGVATGDYNAAFFIGGNRSGSKSWNGSNWSAEGDTNRDNTYLASGAGTTEAALIFGGGSGSNDSIGHVSKNTELYNGSAWSEVNDMLIPKYKGSQTGIGSSNSTISYGGCGQAATYNPPSPFSPFSIGDPRQEGTHLEEWNGTNWSYLGDFYAHPQPSFFNHSGAGVGTTNAASFYGGYTHHFGGGGNNSTQYHWDGTAMANGVSMLIPKSNNDGAGQGGASSAHSSIFGWYQPGYGGSHPTYGAAAIGLHEQYEVFITTGSFGLLKANRFSGDGSGLTNVNTAPAISASAQLASSISGSFNKGFEFSGKISGSADSTGSFSRLTATTISGDGGGLTNVFGANTVSSSAQLATSISGSFTSGFEFDGTIKPAVGAWSIGGTLNNVRSQEGGVGTQNAFIATDQSRYTEIYDGSSWSECNDMNVGRVQVEVAGSSTSALAFGGFGYPMFNRNDSEEWNGNNWSVSTGMPISRSNHSGAGQTDADSALAFGGGSNSGYPTPTDIDTVEWNGSSWTTYSETGLHPACRNGVGFGSTEAALYHNLITFNKTWDGSSWSSIANSLQGHDKGSGGGTVNDGIVFGGSNDGQCTTELFDGTSWSQQGALTAARIYTDGGGTVAGNVLAVGAQSAPQRQTAEHFSLSFTTGSFGRVLANTLEADGSKLGLSMPEGAISSSAQLADNVSGSFRHGFEFTGDIRTAKGVWSAGSALNTARTTMREAGTQNAALAMGGTVSPSRVANSEEYNGSIWSEGNDMITARAGGMGAGTQNAALVAFGNDDSGPTNCTEEYNGTSYATGGDGILARHSMSGVGTQTSALAISGYAPNSSTLKAETEAYDGHAFSEVGNVLDARGNHASAGTQNSAIFMGGSKGSGTLRKNTEFWDGTSWTQVADLVMPQGNLLNNHSAGGNSNSAWIAGGNAPAPTGYVTSTEHWDGISWSAEGNLNTARQRLGGTGDQKSALVFGGEDGSTVGNTEEYNAYYTTGSFGRVETPEVTISGENQLVVEKSLQIPVYATSTGIVSSSAGQVWFTTDDNKLNFTYNYNAWTETAALPTAVGNSKSGAGSTMNDALQFQGTTTSPSITAPGVTQQWNGTAWSEVNATNEGRAFSAGVGLTSDSALNFGGCLQKACTEEWNGTNWSEVGDLNNGRHELGGAGTVNAAWATQGEFHGGSAADKAEAWDGTSWSTILSSGTPHYIGEGGMVTGTQQAHMIVTVAPAATNAIWNGTSYSYANTLGVFGSETGEGGALFGTVNSSVYAGGQAHVTTKNSTYEWNGTSWNKSSATLAQGREEAGTSGKSSAGMIFGGSTGQGSPYVARANSEQYITVNIKTQKVDSL